MILNDRPGETQKNPRGAEADVPRARRADRRRALRAPLRAARAHHRPAGHCEVDAGGRALPPHRRRELLPVAADALHDARRDFRRGEPPRAGAGRLPTRDRAQAARSAYRVSRRDLQGELVDSQRNPHGDQRAALSQRQGDRQGAAALALRREQRAAGGRRAAGALRPLSPALRRQLYLGRLPLSPHARSRRGARADDADARRAAADAERDADPADPEPYLSRYRRYPARAQAEKPRSLRPALPPVAQPVAGPRLLVRRKGSQGRRPLFPRARALARSAGATRGTRGDPRASARLRGRDQGAALRVARGARLRAAPLADQRGARPRLHRSAHQAQEHPRARRPDYGQSEGDGPARRPRRRDQGRDRRDSERNAPHIRSPLTAKGLMPPKRKKTAAKPRVLQPLPQNTCWIESDAYDRRVFGTLRAEAPSLRSIEETGSTFLPHFDSLLQDIFCVLFKNNVVVQAEREMPPSARFNRIFLSALRQGELYAILREMTTLNEAKAGLCTLLLGESLIALLKAEKLLTRREMLDLWDIQKQEEIFTEKQNEFTEAEKLTAEQAD